ncbi:MAG: manganese efflux pump [Bacilli bacterium]
MDWIWLSFIYGIALAMDCLALAITDGLCFQNICKKKYFFIASVFAMGQILFPLLGHFIGLLGSTFTTWFGRVDHWIAFTLLLFIGGKMLYEGIKGAVKPEESKPLEFTYRYVLFQGVADSIDALVVGVTIGANIHIEVAGIGDYRPYIAFLIIGLMTFIISLIGLFAGKQIAKLLKGRYEIAEVIGGVVLCTLAVFVLLNGLGVINL